MNSQIQFKLKLTNCQLHLTKGRQCYMYENIKLSKSQAREIAYDLYDIIVQGIKEMEENKSIEDVDKEQCAKIA